MSHETDNFKDWPKIKSWNLFQINGIAIIDVTGVKQFPVISPRENNCKIFHLCRRQSKRHKIVGFTGTQLSEKNKLQLIIVSIVTVYRIKRIPFSSPSIKPTLTWGGGWSNQEISTSASTIRTRRSDATTFEQNKQIFLLCQGLDSILRFEVILASHS